MATLGDRIRQVRDFRSMSQYELAERTGLSHTTVVRLENDQIDEPKFSTVCLVAQALRVSVSALLFSPAGVDGLSADEQLQAADLLAGLDSGLAVILRRELTLWQLEV